MRMVISLMIINLSSLGKAHLLSAGSSYSYDWLYFIGKTHICHKWEVYWSFLSPLQVIMPFLEVMKHSMEI